MKVTVRGAEEKRAERSYIKGAFPGGLLASDIQRSLPYPDFCLNACGDGNPLLIILLVQTALINRLLQ